MSTRTIYRRLKRGDVEKRQTSQGARYRSASEAPESTDTDGVSADSHDTVSDVTGVSATEGESTDTRVSAGVSRVSGVSELTALVSELVDDVRDLERENARLRADLEHLRENVAPDTDPEGESASQPDETSEPDDGDKMTAKEMVDLLRSTAKDDSSSS